MTTAKQLDAKFIKAQQALLAELSQLQMRTTADIVTFLKAALEAITQQINAAPLTEWEAWRLPKLQQEIKRVLEELSQQLATTGNSASAAAWENGISRVIAPLNAMQSGIIAPNLLQIDATKLSAMRVFMVDKLTDISTSAVGKINAQLGLIAIGATDRHQAVQVVSKLLDEGGKQRAKTIIDTELSRMSETARHETHTKAAERIPGLKKKWRRSGKIHSRRAHDLADGQTVAVNEPFINGGDEMMYPHDPKAPIKQTVNCGCKSLMHVEGWNVSNKGKKPFTDLEKFLNPTKKELAKAKPVGEV